MSETMNCRIVKTRKPYGLFKKITTTRFEVLQGEKHIATFAGEDHLLEAEATAKQFKALMDAGKSQEAEELLCNYGLKQ